MKLTLGGRLENWRALDGFNINTIGTMRSGVITSSVPTIQPGLNSTNFSPKASLSFDPNKEWNITANFGEAYRYPTVTELYQNVAVGTNIILANPFLTPEQDFTGELNIERKWNDGRVRLTLFKEQHQQRDHLANQHGDHRDGEQTTATTISNVDAIRMQGVELSAEKDNVGIKGLQLFGSVTYVDSRILADAGWAGLDPLNRAGPAPPWSASACRSFRTGGPSSA